MDAATTKIKVTFSKNMSDGSWSWSTASKDSFPDTTGRPHYEKDKRTCVLPVKLKPGTTYRLSLNAPEFKNFQSAAGVSLEPVAYTFKTSDK